MYIAAAIAVAQQFGDMILSTLKRQIAQKD